jgi:DNA-directed RNA polymerase subunit RPC12/RpoP
MAKQKRFRFSKRPSGKPVTMRSAPDDRNRWISPKAWKLMSCKRCGAELVRIPSSAKWKSYLECPACFAAWTQVVMKIPFPRAMHVYARELLVDVHLEPGREAQPRQNRAEAAA